MLRSWAYILMILATLVGIVALVWPSPQVQTIEQIASVEREAPARAEPVRAPKAAAKAQTKDKKPAEAPPPPPPVVTKMPAPNTTTRRAGPLVQNGLEPQMQIKPEANAGSPAAKAPAVRPATPPRPGTQGQGAKPATPRPMFGAKPHDSSRPSTAPRSMFGAVPHEDK